MGNMAKIYNNGTEFAANYVAGSNQFLADGSAQWKVDFPEPLEGTGIGNATISHVPSSSWNTHWWF